MKRIAFILLLCLSIGTLLAQESIKLQNAGNDALNAKDYATALANYEKAMAVWGTAPQDSVMYYNCGYCAIQVKDYDKAIKYYNLAATHNYKAADASFKIVAIYKFQKNNESYLKALSEGFAKYPDNASFKGEISKNYLLEGVSHYNAGNGILKAAIDKMNAKKFKDANDPGYKAEIIKAKKEFSDAIPSFDKATELNPADTKAAELKAACEKQVKAL